MTKGRRGPKTKPPVTPTLKETKQRRRHQQSDLVNSFGIR